MTYGKTKRPRQCLYMDAELIQALKLRAERNERSVNKEAIYILRTVINQEKEAAQQKSAQWRDKAGQDVAIWSWPLQGSTTIATWMGCCRRKQLYTSR